MTPNEFKNAMNAIKIKYDGDPENMHAYADDLMCELLKELGYGEGVEIFENMERWCA